MSFINILGIIAAIFTTSSLIPQLIQIIKTKSTKGVSFSMFALFLGGLFFWLIYGILIKSFPIIISNVTSMIIDIIILVYKFKYK